jgi:diaminopimelate epimerase
MLRAVRNGFWKGHGLGNDYLVVDPRELDFRLSKHAVRALCDRHQGVGADGVLALVPTRRADFGVRIYNPDGSEAEKSGNGLRIFGRYLHATRRTRRTSFTVATRGGVVALELQLDRRGQASRARVAMGRASFRPKALPCSVRADELVDRPIRVGARRLRFTGVSVGNPHCVVFRARGAWSVRDLRALGPRLETHPWFPRRVNVQLARVRGPHALDVLVWERGAGETQASGSSACAAACAGVRLGLLRSPVRVTMPGGALDVEVGPDYDVTLAGPVEAVASGQLADSWIRSLSLARPLRTGSFL